MITRRHIRIRVVQSLYSFLIKSPSNEYQVRSFLESSLNQVQDLLLLECSLFQKIHALLQKKSLIIKQTMFNEQKPYLNYVLLAKNPYLFYFSNHPDLKNISNEMKGFWILHESFVNSLIDQLLESDEYHQYSCMDNPNNDQHQDILIYFFKNIVAPSETLQEIYQEYSLSYTDDLPLVNTYLLKILGKIDLNHNALRIIPDKNQYKKEIKFGINLLDKVLSNMNFIKKQYQYFIKNWTIDRLVTIDSAILNVAIAEMLYFEDIPPKVTINEYLEIAKDYSTDKSAIFINGILDQLLNNR